MPEIPNITENIARLREKRDNDIFKDTNPHGRGFASKDAKTPGRTFRSSALSWLAIGFVGALFIFEIFAANLFTLIDR
ncbi:MAG: hypothetical protein AAGB06_02095 [Verrucomicrobiota bacterium]